MAWWPSAPRRARSRFHRRTRSGAAGWGRASCSSSIPPAGSSSKTSKPRPTSCAAFRSTTRRASAHLDPAAGDDDSSIVLDGPPTGADLRFLAGLHAENARLDIKTMALEGHEPLWSMGDDTPIPGLGRIDRPVADHLRQSFAQVTNPPIDPERERAVMDLRVELGRRPALLGGPPAGSRTIRLERPFLADLPALLRAFGGPVRRLDATWPAADGPAGLVRGPRPARRAKPSRAARGRTELIVLSDRAFSFDRLPIPSVLAAGTVDAALSAAGLRGRADVVVEAADVLDVHGAAMVLAVGATGLIPWLAIEMAAELAGTRGAEELDAAATVANLLAALDAGLRKTLARMGISTASSYIGGKLFETIELDDDVRSRCFPAAPAWPGRVGFADLAERQLRRRTAALAVAADDDVEQAPGPGVRPVPGRRRDPSLRPEDRHRDPGAVRVRAARSDNARPRPPHRSRAARPSSATRCASAGRAA